MENKFPGKDITDEDLKSKFLAAKKNKTTPQKKSKSPI